MVAIDGSMGIMTSGLGRGVSIPSVGADLYVALRFSKSVSTISEDISWVGVLDRRDLPEVGGREGGGGGASPETDSRPVAVRAWHVSRGKFPPLTPTLGTMSSPGRGNGCRGAREKAILGGQWLCLRLV